MESLGQTHAARDSGHGHVSYVWLSNCLAKVTTRLRRKVSLQLKMSKRCCEMLWGHLVSSMLVLVVPRSFRKYDELAASYYFGVLNDSAASSRIKKLIDTSSFVAVNLYAKSIFGEAGSWQVHV